MPKARPTPVHQQSPDLELADVVADARRLRQHYLTLPPITANGEDEQSVRNAEAARSLRAAQGIEAVATLRRRTDAALAAIRRDLLLAGRPSAEVHGLVATAERAVGELLCATPWRKPSDAHAIWVGEGWSAEADHARLAREALLADADCPLQEELDFAERVARAAVGRLATDWRVLASASPMADPLVGLTQPAAAPVSRSSRRRGMSVIDADAKAKALIEKMGAALFCELPERQQARRIGCSWYTWSRTPTYGTCERKAEKAQRRERMRPNDVARKTVSLTKQIEAMATDGEKNEVLNRLIEQAQGRAERWQDLAKDQEADFEPSPLATDPPVTRRRVRPRL